VVDRHVLVPMPLSDPQPGFQAHCTIDISNDLQSNISKLVHLTDKVTVEQ